MELISTLPEQITANQLAALYQEILANGDNKNATKLLDLYEKMTKDEFVVSFAGHFSAGKSSMINKLVGEDILPQSPIPTSANVVKINSGDGVARVYFHHDAPVEYKEPYDIDMIKEYCKDKDTIKKIELSTAKKIVPERTAIFDTPGIDAADDADRLITESSLHVVDVLFYVMDYNHVQSEVNLQFLNSLDQKGIPFYVIINQIDKHDEMEIPFKKFETSIKQTFDQWNIHPEQIYYSSLVRENAAHNQFPIIKQKLHSLMTTDRDMFYSINSSVRQVIHEHIKMLTNECNEKIAEYENINDNQQEIYESIAEIQDNIAAIKSSYNHFEQDFKTELQSTLKNAYIMPYELRDKAQSFLESQQSDFKVGLFGSKKKTKDEREMRLNAFLDALRESMVAAIQWKLRDKFANLFKRYSINNTELLQITQQISIDYTAADIQSLVKSGAKVNGDYVLNYTNDISSNIKQKYKQEALQVLNRITEEIKKKNDQEITTYLDRLAKLNNTRDQIKNIEVIKQSLKNKQSVLEEILLHPNQSVEFSLDEILKKKYHKIEQGSYKHKISESTNNEYQSEQNELDRGKTEPLDSVLQSIDQTISIITALPGFQTIIDDLKGKQKRLANRTHTIALFGAFSAGKSSFANALIGNSVLPVSPNPTTATINRIRPTTENYKHGTVVVKMKSSKTLLDDLMNITKDFSPSSENFADLLGWVQDNAIHSSEDLQQMYQAYLQAMIRGYDNNKTFIGEDLTITLDEFADYVSDETKACYVESIDLYYDCQLTEQGITLVDTPGADSVNSRHTNVAFDYIKYADAILYVTYYNHALSRADKDFLMQLGRVKDTFQLDKMFFVVNAADLAKDTEELTLVTNYVEEQLVQLGIRFPKLFPISSKQALEAKRNNQALPDQMQTFEEKFHHFIRDDLALLSIQAAVLDIKRAYQSMTNYIESANLNDQEKESYRLDLFAKREKLEDVISSANVDLYAKQINQKIEKQLYYVLERFSIRFHDMFKETFNPTTITGTGKQAQAQLSNSMKSLLDYTGYELVQEIRAVSLRIESYMYSLANDAYETIIEKSTQIDEKLVLPSLMSFDLSTPEYDKAFGSIEKNTFHKALSGFKGTKSFFEKNEKEHMKEAIYESLAPIAKEYIDENKVIMMQAYIAQWNHVMETIQQETIKNIDSYIDNYLSMMTETIDIELLTEKQYVLSTILKTHGVQEV
ncbi:dynamin family protein [Virgibacillus ndiopensis]|uniref:dynamin family protein n=1 Tax=Virgibacillus ndiopensis TaxID=2004408 RepID=UPI00159B8B6D|nr:dynamin family protein [Virgibacillus ndiopensis]